MAESTFYLDQRTCAELVQLTDAWKQAGWFAKFGLANAIAAKVSFRMKVRFPPAEEYKSDR